MQNFLWPIFGGVLIGFSAVLLMLFIGRIAGISGIIWGVLSKQTVTGDRSWRWVFLIGLVLGTVVFHAISGKPVPEVADAPFQAMLAGLLVGIGVAIGNGCTSGHGVCGIGRLSVRSLVATITFMLTAIVTVALT